MKFDVTLISQGIQISFYIYSMYILICIFRRYLSTTDQLIYWVIITSWTMAFNSPSNDTTDREPDILLRLVFWK